MEFELRDEYITLAQLLKACDVVYSGGEGIFSKHGSIRKRR